MGVLGAFGSLLKLHLDHHQLTVITHNLSLDAIPDGLPFHLTFHLEQIAACLHHY